jgi:type VI secretion system protein ImpA
MELSHLLAEASELPPCGPDLEYDPAYLALDVASQGKPEQDVAGTVVPAVEPDWADVLDQAQGLLVRSKDLRVAIQLVRALTRLEGLTGFLTGIELVDGLLERYWPDVHPRLDADDNQDPTFRLNALAPLEPSRGSGATETLLRDVREATVVPPTPQSRVTVRDLLIIDGKLTGATLAQPVAAVEEALRAAIERNPQLAEVPSRAIAAAQRLRARIAERVGGELAPDVGSITEMLRPAAQRMARLSGRADLDSGESRAVGGATALSSSIQGREDVNRAIDAICLFLERTEPANPAPLLLRRAQRLLNKSFVELIADLAPDSVGQVKMIAGLKNE